MDDGSVYTPELGQAAFGCSWNEFFVDENISELLYNLSEKLLDSNSSD